jgi:G:T-mismatch repair DNA endonuclease (very short patch repair protein)
LARSRIKQAKAGWTVEDLAVQSRDSDRFAYLKAQGYKVVVIWECEIERDPEWVRSLLRSLKP